MEAVALPQDWPVKGSTLLHVKTQTQVKPTCNCGGVTEIARVRYVETHRDEYQLTGKSLEEYLRKVEAVPRQPV